MCNSQGCNGIVSRERGRLESFIIRTAVGATVGIKRLTVNQLEQMFEPVNRNATKETGDPR